MPKNGDPYVDTGATMKDAYEDLSYEDFTEMMSELGYALQGPAEAPATPEMSKLDRIKAIKQRIRNLLGQGYTLNASGASEFTAQEMMQRKMESYNSGLGAGTGHSAEILADRIKRGK